MEDSVWPAQTFVCLYCQEKRNMHDKLGMILKNAYGKNLIGQK